MVNGKATALENILIALIKQRADILLEFVAELFDDYLVRGEMFYLLISSILGE